MESKDFQRYGLVCHSRTNNFYIIEKFLKVRVGDTWVAGVMYCEVDDRETSYVRTLDNFTEAFHVPDTASVQRRARNERD